VPSIALISWQGPRSERLDELLLAHATIGGAGPGRRWRTTQLNWALMLRLAGEFQGYCRELHDAAVEAFIRRAAPGNRALRDVLRLWLVGNRQLDRGNAQPKSLGADFGRFGLTFWTTMVSLEPLTSVRQGHLERLNKARNAIAHDLAADLAKLAADGYPMTLRTFRRWRRALDGLASTMDQVVGTHLGALFGRAAPW